MGLSRILNDVHVSCITCMRLETHLELIMMFLSNLHHFYLLVSFIKIPGSLYPKKRLRTPRCHLSPLLHWVLQVQVHNSGLTIPFWTIHQHRTRTLCTSFLLADSLTLDCHPILNAAPGPGQAEKLLWMRKDWTANLPARPGIQGKNPTFPNGNISLYI